MNKKNRNLGITLAFLGIVLMIGVIYIFDGRIENISNNKYGIQDGGEIIAKVSNENTIDIIVKQNEDAFFYTFEVEKNKEYKKLLEFSSENYFSYTGRKNALKNEDELYIQIELMGAFYDDTYKNVERKPYWGVSISPEINKLKIDNQLVDKIIEYKDGGHVFYIWYFRDLNINHKNFDINQ